VYFQCPFDFFLQSSYFLGSYLYFSGPWYGGDCGRGIRVLSGRRKSGSIGTYGPHMQIMGFMIT